MKSSRAMLLAAILFSAPVSLVLAENTDAPKVSTTNAVITTATKTETENVIVDPKNHVETHVNTTTTEVKVEKKDDVQVEKPSWTKAKLAAVGAAIGSTSEFVSRPAAWGLNQFTRISFLKGGRFESSIPTLAKVITAATIIALAVKLYEVANDDVDANDDEIFGEDNN